MKDFVSPDIVITFLLGLIVLVFFGWLSVGAILGLFAGIFFQRYLKGKRKDGSINN